VRLRFVHNPYTARPAVPNAELRIIPQYVDVEGAMTWIDETSQMGSLLLDCPDMDNAPPG
jgi:hypothetical protein